MRQKFKIKISDAREKLMGMGIPKDTAEGYLYKKRTPPLTKAHEIEEKTGIPMFVWVDVKKYLVK